MKARLTVEIECGVETCFVGVGEPCGMVDRGRARCLHFRKALEMSRGWYQRLPDCLAQAVPASPLCCEGMAARGVCTCAESADEDQAAGESRRGLCPSCGGPFHGALPCPDSAAPPEEEGERCESMSDKGHRCTMTDPHAGTGDEPHKARDGGLIWVGPPHPATPEQEGVREGTWCKSDRCEQPGDPHWHCPPGCPEDKRWGPRGERRGSGRVPFLRRDPAPDRGGREL